MNLSSFFVERARPSAGLFLTAGVVVSLVGLSVVGEERDRICRLGFSASIRPSVEATEAIKRAMLRAAGISLSRLHDYELDAVVPACLGGSHIDRDNLQLQRCYEWRDRRCVAGPAYEKDQGETCRAYCAGEMTLERARGMFTRDRQ